MTSDKPPAVASNALFCTVRFEHLRRGTWFHLPDDPQKTPWMKMGDDCINREYKIAIPLPEQPCVVMQNPGRQPRRECGVGLHGVVGGKN